MRTSAPSPPVTNALAGALATQLTVRSTTSTLTIGAYTHDGELPGLELPDTSLTPTARWWRVVAHRAAQAVPGTRITHGS